MQTIAWFCPVCLPTKLSAVGIDESKFELMAKEAVRTSGISSRAYVKLDEKDVKNIFDMCK